MKKDSAKEALLFLFPWVIAGFALRLWHALLSLVMCRDETAYAYEIKHILNGTIFADPTYYTFPPVYPALAAPIALITGDAEFAGRLTSCILGAATAIPAFYLAKSLFGRRAAVIAAAVTALFPPLMSVAVMSEPTYGFFITLGLYLANKAYETGRVRDYSLFGFVLALAYLSRPEGLFVFFACLAILAAILLYRKAGTKKVLSLSAAALAGFFILAFPYMLQLKAHFGAWEISGKTRINLAKIRAIETFVPGQNYDAHETQVTMDLESGKKSLTGNVLSELSAISRRYPGNLKAELRSFSSSAGYPLLIAALLGLVFILRSKDAHRSLILAGAFAPALLIPMVFVLDRILIPYIPVLIVVAAYGVSRLSEIIGKRTRPFIRMDVSAPAFASVCTLALFIGNFGLLPETDREKILGSYPSFSYYFLLRELGEQARGITGEGARIITRNNIYAYYAGAEYVPLPPTEDINGLLEYARQQKAGYLIYGPMEQDMRPGYLPVFMKNGVPQDDPLGDGRIMLVGVWGDSFLLYEINLERL